MSKEYVKEGYAAGKAGCGRGTPSHLRLSGPPQGTFSEFNPISCNLRDSEIIFITFSKVIFQGHFGSKSEIIFMSYFPA